MPMLVLHLDDSLEIAPYLFSLNNRGSTPCCVNTTD